VSNESEGLVLSQQLADNLIATFALRSIKFVHEFCEENRSAFAVFETAGINTAESLRDADADALLFLVTLLKRCRNEQVGRAIVAHVLDGRLRLAGLKPLSIRLGGRADGTAVRVRPELIAVFGFKIYGYSNQEIADQVGLSLKRVKNIGTELYQPWVGTAPVAEQRKVTLLWRAAVDEGYVGTGDMQSSSHI
jgi:hypothetical protein